MNVLFLTLYGFESLQERNIYPDLLREFVKNGHQVYVISPTEKREGKETHIVKEENYTILRLQIGNTQKTNIIEKGISTVMIEPKFKKAIKQYFSNVKFDLVLYSTPPITLVSAIEYVKNRDGAKTYLLLKDIFPQNAVDIVLMSTKGIKGLLYKHFRKQEKKLYRISDRIGCMSQANVDYVIKHNPKVDPNKVEVCPNSLEIIDKSVDEETRRQIRTKYGIPLEKIVFVYGGNLGKPQGIPFLIECLKKCTGIENAFFLIIGDGTDYPLIQSFIETENPINVKLMKRLPREDYDTMVGACDVGLIFLDYRFTIPNFPSRLLSYMQAGLPVLACTDPNTDIGKVIVDGGFGWWCESDDTGAFTKVVDQAVNSPLDEMSEDGRQYLLEHYTSEKGYEIINKACGCSKVGMKRLLEINSVCGIRSTGRIATDIAEDYIKNGWEVKIAYGRDTVPGKYKDIAYRIGSDLDAKINALSCRIFDNDGFAAKSQTKEFLKWATEYDPDELWLHNLHGYYINIEMLFDWIKSRPEIMVHWTLHDCWAFTGHCAYFTAVNCDKWQSHCAYCVQKTGYPKSILMDNSKENFDRKKAAVTGVKDMTIITPSQWLADLVEKSFLNEYNAKVRHNTIDTAAFKLTPSNFREKYGLTDKKIVLGVASAWEARKGLNDFYKLATVLPKEYMVVLVGLTEKQMKQAPQEIIKIQRTNSQEELAEIYSAADVFVNPSVQETFGMTALEAISCGVKPTVLKGTACEDVVNTYGGVAVEHDIGEIVGKIYEICGGDYLMLINRTNSVKDLAAIYSASDIFLNLTYEDNYPTVNLEAQACGTRCVTYRTGGSVESVRDEDVVDQGSIKDIIKIIGAI